MKLYTFLFMALVFFISCKNQNELPKVTYDSLKVDPKSTIATPDVAVEIADLPIQIEGLRYIIHPIGTLRVGQDDKKYGGNSYVLSNYNRNELTGNFSNLKFQHQDSTTFKMLTDKNIAIQNVTYLDAVARNAKKQYLVYILEDLDSNKDGKLDDSDIKDLYISEVSGTNFKKLSPDYQEVIDWKLIDFKNRIYFRTVEDINKNGAFDKNDKLHYYFIDLLAKTLQAEEYNPI